MNENNPRGRCSRCGGELRYGDDRCPNCGGRNENWVIPDRDKQCGNCHASLQEGDRYCRRCGTSAGEGAYEPYQNVMQCIYGPRPVKRIHICEKCGYSWSTVEMLDRDKYCPKCGGNAPYTEDENR